MHFFSSNAGTLNKIQLFTSIASFLGIFYFQFTLANVTFLILSFYAYSILGLSMTLHRYYTHKSFKMHPCLQIMFTFIALLAGRGSPLGWVYIHRLHHAFSDTEKDPHTPRTSGFKLFGFKPIDSSATPNVFIIKDLMTPQQIFINKYYLLIIISWLIVLGLIRLDLIYFTWVLPVFLIHLSQNSFNYFAHTSGYRNFSTKDNSTNNFWLWPFVLGDAWHNNHHANAEKISTQHQKYEFDPIAKFISLIKR